MDRIKGLVQRSEESWRIQHPKHCEYNNQNEENSQRHVNSLYILVMCNFSFKLKNDSVLVLIISYKFINTKNLHKLLQNKMSIVDNQFYSKTSLLVDKLYNKIMICFISIELG